MKIQSNSQSVTKEMQIKAMRKVFHPSNWRKEQVASDSEERVVTGRSHLLRRAIYQCLLHSPRAFPESRAESRAVPAGRGVGAQMRMEAAGSQNEPPQHSSLFYEDSFELKAVKTLQVQREQRQNIL